jgi:hypothetical protein
MRENVDINDTLRLAGPDAVRGRHDRARKFGPKGNGRAHADAAEPLNPNAGANRDARSHALPLIFFDDLAEVPQSKPWLIKNVIARDETSSWIAPPGKGKSALLTDIAVHSAAGMNWRGHRTKGIVGAVYFALERA